MYCTAIYIDSPHISRDGAGKSILPMDRGRAMLKRMATVLEKVVLEVVGIFICSHVMWLQSFNLAIVTLTCLTFLADIVPKVYNDNMLLYLM